MLFERINSIEVYMPLKNFSFSVPTKILFGVNQVCCVGAEALALGGKKALIITDKNIVKVGLVDRVRDQLEEDGLDVDIFDEVEPEPHIECANLVTDFIRKRDSDIFVGVGGGSCLDMTKVASIMATNPGKVEQYLGKNTIRNLARPKILIPTTAGTGSECSSSIVIHMRPGETLKSQGLIMDRKVYADVGIVDPLMSITMPPRLTANTAFDALSHAIESTMALGSNPMSEALAFEAIRLVANNLKKAYYRGEDLVARYHLAVAASMAIQAATSGGSSLGHGMQYPLTTHYKTHHGEGCGIVLPYVMNYNLPLCVDKFAKIAEAMGENINGLTLQKAAKKALYAVIRLLRDVENPTCLRDMNIPKEDLSMLAEECATKYPRPTNVRKATKEDILEIYQDMWEGKI